MTFVQPSMVMHWNTVSMANPMLSKLTMPFFGPAHSFLHAVPLIVHWCPLPVHEPSLSGSAHGDSSSSPNSGFSAETKQRFDKEEPNLICNLKVGRG